jgi:hypothetical protein
MVNQTFEISLTIICVRQCIYLISIFWQIAVILGKLRSLLL